jgi:hypothetical protein
VADAMGAMTLNSIEYSGSGSLFGFGQAFIPGERWPRLSSAAMSHRSITRPRRCG